MSVLIKGMEMPKEGSWVTLRVFPDGQCFLYSWCEYDFDFMEHLTAAPVPDHGRLIDADALREAVGKVELEAREEYYELSDAEKECEYEMGVWDGIHMAAKILSTAPTIIPASEEVYDKYTDTAGNLHWTGTHSGKHIIPVDKEEKK